MNKILTHEEIAWEAVQLKEAGKRVVFTNGCFDILHAGHVRYLTAARAEGDILVIGLNSDESVRLIKGEKRPIVPQTQRAEVLSGLSCVDYIVFFDEPDPSILIKDIAPDVLVKGGDWAEEDIIGADFVKAKGGRVVRISVVPGISTSSIIKRILEIS
ncbi:MAG: D-glycero-beta-D-manno-heptose 1-phosphate adenylyltransferase [Desulfobacteraceae bacterium]|nr:MAG: D-glycero-beta-D-manno-heptose 1-phosphate adenylyltransferase [Desulfobacteraceae bacterium]